MFSSVQTTNMTDKNSNHLEVTVRRALKGDKTAVLEAASGAFHGFDYLPYSYDHVIEDPNHVYFLAEVDGEVVSGTPGKWRKILVRPLCP